MERILESAEDRFVESKQQTIPYRVDDGRSMGFDLWIESPEVWSPEFFNAHQWFLPRVAEAAQGKDVLEVGCGSGIGVLYFSRIAKHAYGVDVVPAAVANTLSNIKRNKVKNAGAALSDVYDGIGDARFDLIYWNSPWGYVESGKDVSGIEYGTYDPGYAAIRRFIEQAPAHLNHGGHLYLGLAEEGANLPLLGEIIKQSEMKLDRIIEGRNLSLHRDEKDERMELHMMLYVLSPKHL